MAKVRSPWRLLRPLLLAGAVTASWLTLSSSAASADSPAEPGSLLDGVASSVSSNAAPLTNPVSPLVETKSPAAPPATPAGLPQPVVGSIAKTADHLVAAFPVVESIIPTGTVSTVAVPVAAAADGAVSGLVEVAVPPLVDAVPVLEPVVKPVTDLVTGETRAPDLLPVVLAPTGDLPEASALDATATGTSTEVPAAGAVARTETVAHAAAASPATSLGLPRLSGFGTAGAGLQPASQAAPLTGEPTPSPGPAPAAPASGAGNGASPSGASGAASWLNDFEFDLPLSGAYLISEAFGHAPAPVSFDPGSSPD